MYTLNDYGEMLKDKVRLEAYSKAIQAAAPGARVLEIGGGTGFFACLAAHAGAAEVVSVDLNPLLQWGPQMARRNGASKIHFVLGRAQEYRADFRADIILHDLRGQTPFYAESLLTLKDAERFLAPGGCFLARADRVYAALVEDESFYAQMEGVYAGELGGLDLRSCRIGTHRRMRYRPSERSQHFGAHRVCDINYGQITDTELQTTLKCCVETEGVSHGLVLWFETDLHGDIGFSTDPWLPSAQRGTTYGNGFFPWPDPVYLKPGMPLEVDISIKADGTAACKLFEKRGALRLPLGRFRTANAHSPHDTLPLDYRFEKRSNIKPYRVALQALERGDKVSTAVARIQQKCPEVKDKQTAIDVVVKAAKLVQAGTKPGRQRKKRMTCRGAGFTLVTTDGSLEQEVLDTLPSIWKATRKGPGSNTIIRLQEVIYLHGKGYLCDFNGQRSLHDDRTEILQYLDSLISDVILPQSRQLVVMDCGFSIKNGKGCLVFEDDKLLRQKTVAHLGGMGCWKRAVLDRQGRLIPYLSGSEITSFPVTTLHFCQQDTPGKALLISSLLGRSRSNSTLKNPVEFFQDVLDNLESVGTDLLKADTGSGRS
jgi:SAM-dependent methyltransferase